LTGGHWDDHLYETIFFIWVELGGVGRDDEPEPKIRTAQLNSKLRFTLFGDTLYVPVSSGEKFS
jgi:hypothetical protein